MLLTQVPSYFKARRDALMKANPGAGFILPSNREVIRNSMTTYPFRQDSNFFYLTGFDEPEAFLVLVPSGKAGGYRSVMFVQRRDPEREMWDGERYGVEGALRVFGVDEAYVISELDAKLPELLKGCEKVCYRVGLSEENDRRVLAGMDNHRKNQGRTGRGLLPILDPIEILGELRLFKSADEIEIIRRSCRITALAHKKAMETVRPGMNESEVEALIEYEFRRNGCQRVGYWSIVAGGHNATCLHYRFNNEVLRDGDLLLIDAGGEHGYLTADITRTFPVGRRFSPTQARVYDLVLKSQLEAISMAKPGATLPAIHQRVCEILVDGMLSMGLLQGTPKEVLESGAFKRFFPHNTSHWLGMDVHDSGLYQKGAEPRKLEPGMVFTIEPGFYVQPTDRDVPPEFRDIGIRIEDDILITSSGCEVLTRDVPKDRAEIEKLRG